MTNALDIPQSQIVWLAGILDGEGSFQLEGKKYPRLRLVMAEDQTDTVERVAKLWGRPVRDEKPYKNNKQSKKCVVLNGRSALFWLLLMYPYLSAKRKEQVLGMMVVWFRSGARIR